MPLPTETKNFTNSKEPNKRKFSRQGVLNHLKMLGGNHAVAVGLSGGVDSSLTAALLVEAGWHVEGITLWLMKGQGSCCSDGLIDAAGICEQLEVKHHIIDARETFNQEIVNHLVSGYEKGITPSPCSRCNRSVKFSEMIEWTSKHSTIDRIATGHYARIKYAYDTTSFKNLPESSRDKHKLLRGLDRNKDQSYFLYDLSQDTLGKIIFPLGELTKEETRLEAQKYGLKTANKPESQDLCLSEHYGSMKAFLDSYIDERKGQIVLQDGTVLGEHDGVEHFTIGQRKGLGISWSVPLHVIKIDATENKVIVGPRSEAGRSSCVVKDINWISIDQPNQEVRAEVQLRYRSLPVKTVLQPIKRIPGELDKAVETKFKLIFDDEQFSITPGQAAVFYWGEIVLGGGIIEK